MVANIKKTRCSLLLVGYNQWSFTWHWNHCNFIYVQLPPLVEFLNKMFTAGLSLRLVFDNFCFIFIAVLHLIMFPNKLLIVAIGTRPEPPKLWIVPLGAEVTISQTSLSDSPNFYHFSTFVKPSLLRESAVVGGRQWQTLCVCYKEFKVVVMSDEQTFNWIPDLKGKGQSKLSTHPPPASIGIG